jgi:uncharacterized protein (TIGR03437 family)
MILFCRVRLLLRSFTVAIAFLSAVSAQEGWQLVWSDEFSGAAKTAPDPTKWAYDTGGGGWGNQELEIYTTSTDNAFLDGNGNLVIRALKTSAGGYTSARLKTQGKFTTTYGKIEARMKIPFGQGMWPAFWMLGSDITTAGWPACGEIDIMENIGKEPSIIHGTVHGPGYSGGNGIGHPYALASRRVADDFHTFTVIWSPGKVEFQVDSNSYFTVTPASLPAGKTWVYDKPFFMLLNLAVGGGWPGYPDATTQFPQDLTVDYVRVYRLASGPAIHAGGILDAASANSALAPGSLSSLFGVGLADDVHDGLFDTASNAFPKSVSGISVTVNGDPAPVTYISPAQINFQIPWQTPVGTPVDVRVIRNDVVSGSQTIVLSNTAPSAFAANGAAILTCPENNVKAGAACTLWGNGFGATLPAQTTGAPSPAAASTVNQCRLNIGGVDATVLYCGSAPGLVIAQLNFVHPSGVSGTNGLTNAILTVGGNSSLLVVPSPAGA